MRDFHLPGRSPVFSANGMCATSHPLAAQTAVETLKNGGSAMDAAIAGALVLGICEPQMTGIGGDLFALVAETPEADIKAFNGSGRAPAAGSASRIRDGGASAVDRNSADAVTVPGAIDGFCQLHAAFGKLELADVLAPTIRYASEGVPVAPRVAFDWAGAAPLLQSTPSMMARKTYFPEGHAPAMGTIFRAPLQAEVLTRVATEGRAGFYEGEVAEDMVDSLRALGGLHTLDDFAKHRGDWTTPLSTTYGAYELMEHAPNGQGVTALLMANMLKHFSLDKMDPFGSERAHLEAEISKLAYDARNRIVADPTHANRVATMLDSAMAASLVDLFDPGRAITEVSTLTETIHKDTIYITVVDKDRMAVSLIYSIFDDFGSCIASEKFGILFQSRGTGFNLTEGHPNEYGGGKRPLHTIIPGMLRKNGSVVMPFGVMGGQYQPTGHVRLLTNLVDYGLDIQGAIDGPRSFHLDGSLRMERGYGDDVRRALAELGHHVVTPNGPLGGAQAIQMSDTGVLIGGSDPRKDGCALGY